MFLYVLFLLVASYSNDMQSMQNVEKEASLLTIKNDTGLQIIEMEIFLKCFNAHPRDSAGLMKLILGSSHFASHEKTFDVENILFLGVHEAAGWGGKSADCSAEYLYKYYRLFTVYEAIKKYLVYGFNIKLKDDACPSNEPMIKEYLSDLADIEKMPAYKRMAMHLTKTNEGVRVQMNGEQEMKYYER